MLIACAPAATPSAATTAVRPSSIPVRQPVAEARVLRDSSGEQYLYIPVTLQGHRVSLILDTGSPFSLLLSPSAFAQFGIPLPNGDVLDSLTVGTVQEHAVGFLQSDFYNFLNTDKLPGLPPVVGILGAQMLVHYDLLFDGGAGRMQLYTPVPRLARAGTPAPSPRTGLPPGFTLADCQPFADSGFDIDVQINGHRVSALFDTGSWDLVMDKVQATQLGITEQSPGAHRLPRSSKLLWGFRNDGSQGWAYDVKVTVTVGSHQLTKVAIVYPDISGGRSMGQLIFGVNTFANQRFFVSHRAGQVCIETP